MQRPLERPRQGRTGKEEEGGKTAAEAQTMLNPERKADERGLGRSALE